MKEKIHNIPINDAMANAGECPFCFIEKKVEDDTLDYVLGSGSSYMEYDTREMTDKAGFCRAHFKKMYDYGNTLGSAWILSTHYDQILKEMDEKFKNFKPGKGKPALPFGKKKEETSNTVVDWINDRNKSCFICKNVEESFNDYVAVFFDMYKKDSEFRAKTNSSQGFCLSHFGILCEAADKSLNEAQLKDFYDNMLPLMRNNMARLKEDVAWLIEKYDYRNKDADWKNSKDANQRAMQKLKGGYHHLPPHQAKK